MRVRWEDQTEEQDDWRDYFEMMREVAKWQEELVVRGEPVDSSFSDMVEEYYARHPGAPRHDDTPHQCAPPPRHRAVRRR